MKFNKQGWGLFEMIVLSGILFIFFLVAIIYIYNLYKTLSKNVINNNSNNTKEISYQEIEEELESISEQYINDNYNLENVNTITVTTKKLHDLGYATVDLPTDCSGYTLNIKINGEITSKAYIDCKNYQTRGYESWRAYE